MMIEARSVQREGTVQCVPRNLAKTVQGRGQSVAPLKITLHNQPNSSLHVRGRQDRSSNIPQARQPQVRPNFEFHLPYTSGAGCGAHGVLTFDVETVETTVSKAISSFRHLLARMISPSAENDDALLHQPLDIGIHTRTNTAIKALAPDVIAGIKSSTTITSLEYVVLQLLKNSLDSNASKVEITIDLKRGSCVVEDDGTGIEPREFADGGGVGKIYNTSRYGSEGCFYGRYGTFLASLGALSLLTIASRHHLHQSHNSITIHRSKVLARLKPAPVHQELMFRDHGTKVSVADLFGAMPVRVKQRAAVVSHAKSWDSLKRDLVAVLLAWQSNVIVRIHEKNGLPPMVLATRIDDTTWNRNGLERARTSVFKADSVPSLLSQASYIDSDDWKQWVPVSATSAEIFIEGSISLDPMPNKQLQFISFGISPIDHRDGHNELYDEINRLFNSSNFGMEDDVSDPSEEAKTRTSRLSSARGNTLARHSKTPRKGVDRWPMFYLRVTFRTRAETVALDDLASESRCTFNSVLKMLQTTITQWLITHGFKDRQHRNDNRTLIGGQKRPHVASGTTIKPIGPITHSNINTPPALKSTHEKSTQRAIHSARAPDGKETRPHTERRFRSFGDWSRIKSGDPKFYEAAWEKRPVTSGPTLQNQIRKVNPSPSNFYIEDVLPGSLNLESIPTDEHEPKDGPFHAPGMSSCCTAKLNDDTTTTWTDPVTRTTTSINTRTGCVTSSNASHSKLVSEQSGGPVVKLSKLAGLIERQQDAVPSPWLSKVLTNWSNPVFHAAEKAIPHISGEALLQLDREFASKFSRNESFLDAVPDRISKDGLASAKVVSQVDRKFILVIVEGHDQKTRKEGLPSRTLVLIDQHAADERCKVEELLGDLYLPPDNSDLTRSNLGCTPHIKTSHLVQYIRFEIPANEAKVLADSAATLATWGIIYDLERKKLAEAGSSRALWMLTVKSLPPSIVERCRLDPKLLLAFLRTESWKLADTTIRQPSIELKTRAGSSWVSQLSLIPIGLLDMINSRACRSAVMFNDILDHQQCVDLVQKLARCAFPFQCAHGRPSMVPLVDLVCTGSRGMDQTSFAGLGNAEEVEPQSFKNAFQAWRKTN